MIISLKLLDFEALFIRKVFMFIYILPFLSGFAGLVYQVLWMRQIGLLFGNTSHAAAATLSAFFAGLAVGSYFWGRRAERVKHALRTYGLLEGGIGVTALMYFAIMGLFHVVYPSVYQYIEAFAFRLVLKFALALLLVFPPAFFMGGTIPVLGQFAVRRREQFGMTSALLYAWNTFGAALGALLAGFFLPLWLGFTRTCVLAMAVTAAVAVLAFVMSKRKEEPTGSEAVASSRHVFKDAPVDDEPIRRIPVALVCFLSGFGVLALEVLWTRMFAQVLENSVYTFAAILVVVLLALAGGSFVSSRLARLKAAPPFVVLSFLMLLGGLAAFVAPHLLVKMTHGLQVIESRASWGGYVLLIFRYVLLVVGPPALILGTLFPYLMRVEQDAAVSAGRSLGRLASLNTIGAILGSLLCGFVLLEWIGMWGSMQLIVLLYLGGVILLPVALNLAGSIVKLGAIALVFLMLRAFNLTALPTVSEDPGRQHEIVKEKWEASDCTVVLSKSEDPAVGWSIKINSDYGLGSTGAETLQRYQSDVPMLAYPGTDSLFYLGMGTGITAGSALDDRFPDVRRVVVCELVDEVIEAAKVMERKTARNFTNGLFSDPRADVLAEDGRHYLMASGESFDLINADLFVPFRSGAGSLYTLEHYQSVKQSLAPGGVFFQWLPMYQLTENEFKIITRTMLEAFDHVSMWRNNFQPYSEVLALAGHKAGTPLPACDIDSAGNKQLAVQGKGFADVTRLGLPIDSQTVLFFYCGNVSVSADLFKDCPVNTDDRPLIEYLAPRTFREAGKEQTPWFVGMEVLNLVDELQRRCPPSEDPLLANRTAENKRLPLAGAAFHRAQMITAVLWNIRSERGLDNPVDWQRFRAQNKSVRDLEAQGRRVWNQFVYQWLGGRTAAPGP